MRSVGHIAARQFREGQYRQRSCLGDGTDGASPDGYTESQLILVSNDTLAQYWKAFGHVSFYKRVDIDQFLNVD